MSESFFFFFSGTSLHWEHIEHFIQNPHSEKLSKAVVPVLVLVTPFASGLVCGISTRLQQSHPSPDIAVTLHHCLSSQSLCHSEKLSGSFFSTELIMWNIKIIQEPLPAFLQTIISLFSSISVSWFYTQML